MPVQFVAQSDDLFQVFLVHVGISSPFDVASFYIPPPPLSTRPGGGRFETELYPFSLYFFLAFSKRL